MFTGIDNPSQISCPYTFRFVVLKTMWTNNFLENGQQQSEIYNIKTNCIYWGETFKTIEMNIYDLLKK